MRDRWARRSIGRLPRPLSSGAALAVASLLAGTTVHAQTAKVVYPPRNVDVRIVETQIRQHREQAARKQWQESRVRKLTGSGEAAQGSALDVPSGNSVAAARIAVQSLIGAAVVAAAMSAFTDNVILEVEGGTGGGSSSPEAPGSTTSTTGTSSTTSTSTSTN